MANPSLSLPKIYISTPFMANPSLSLPEIYIPQPHKASFNRIICRTSVTCSPTQTSKITPMATRTATTSSSLANVWRKIQGFNNWNGLLEPIHPILQSEIVRYGEFVTACYKALDLDPSSKRYCNCKYGRSSMFKEVGMDNSGYEITKYIYATPDINLPMNGADSSSGRWIGYVAVSSEKDIKRLGRRDILITFRGTVTNTEWIANFMSSLTPARLDPHDPRLDVKVEMGFLNLYTSSDSNCKFGHGSCREQLLSEVARVLNKYKEEEVSITLAGHSMGSSLAMLLAYDIAELGLNKSSCCGDVPITVYSFGGPRVGNNAFKERCEELGVKVLRIVNVNDPITKLPGVLFNENFRVLGGRYELPWRTSCYAHVGVELVLDFFKMENPSCVHDLEAYLGLLRCPKGAVERSVGFLSQARQFATREKLNLWKLQNAMTNVGNLVQSLRI